MTNGHATSRVKTLFFDYRSLLTRHGVARVIKENQKLAVAHMLSSIWPRALQERLQADLSFSRHSLKKNFPKFLEHAVKLSDAFQLLSTGPKRKKKRDPNEDRTPGCRGGNGGGESCPSDGKGNPGKPPAREAPLCLWPPHAAKCIRHYMRHCKECPDHEKTRLLKDLAKKRAEGGQASNIRSRTRIQTPGLSNSNGPDSRNPVAERIQNMATSLGCSFTLHSNGAEVICQGRTDDGSDDTIVSARVAEHGVLKGVEKFVKLKTPVTLRVALREEAEATKFTFSRSWLVPRVIIQLSFGQLALINVSFLVADDNLACKDHLIGRLLLAHLGVVSKTLLEHNRSRLDGTNCVDIGNITYASKKVGRLMIARLRKIKGESPRATHSADTLEPARPKSNYYLNRHDVDWFSIPSLIDMADEAQHDSIREHVDEMFQRAKNKGFPPDLISKLQSLVSRYIDVFQTEFSVGPPANIPPLKI